jgi:hypothetical protein
VNLNVLSLYSEFHIKLITYKQIFASWKKNQLATNWPDLQTNLPQNVFFNVYYYNSVNTTIKTVKFSERWKLYIKELSTMLILLKFQQILASNEAALAYLRISFFKCWRSSCMEFRSIECNTYTKVSAHARTYITFNLIVSYLKSQLLVHWYGSFSTQNNYFSPQANLCKLKKKSTSY